MKMKNHAYNPLQVYCDELIDLFQQAITKKDPALFLHQKHARTILFMAESLARLLNQIDRQKETESPLKTFKKLEDLLGAVEDYSNYKELFEKNKSVKKDEKAYVHKKLLKALYQLNKSLIKHEFFQEFFRKVSVIKIDFNDARFVKKIEKQLSKEIKEAGKFYALYPKKFTDFESQVHELRRKLRWVSIYSQSLMGIIVLKNIAESKSWEADFSDKNFADSPYNKLPVKKDLEKYIFLDEKAFHALNLTVDRLGTIKDKALTIETVTKAIKKSGAIPKANAGKAALDQLHIKYTEEDLLEEAHELLKKFFVRHEIHKFIMPD